MKSRLDSGVGVRAGGVETSAVSESSAGVAAAPETRFVTVPDRSTVVLAARSSVGPINCSATGLEGEVTCAAVRGSPCFPSTTVTLVGARSVGAAGRVEVVATLDFHWVKRTIEGVVSAKVLDGERLVITGEKVIDIRDFDIPSPHTLLLRIYPTVRVHLFLEADRV